VNDEKLKEVQKGREEFLELITELKVTVSCLLCDIIVG